MTFTTISFTPGGATPLKTPVFGLNFNQPGSAAPLPIVATGGLATASLPLSIIWSRCRSILGTVKLNLESDDSVASTTAVGILLELPALPPVAAVEPVFVLPEPMPAELKSSTVEVIVVAFSVKPAEVLAPGKVCTTGFGGGT